jgi:hypothetical protein
MKALTVGGAMIDTIAIIASDHIERMSMRNADSSFLLLEEGRKTEALEISTHVGGGAVNAAVAMARLGLDVATLVKLGKDARAETVLNHLLQEGVSTRWAMRDGRAPTGASVLLSSHDRNAGIFTFRGANTLLDTSNCGRRPSPSTSYTSPRSQLNRRMPFLPSSNKPRRKAHWWPPTRACASSPRAAVLSLKAWRTSTFWRSTARRPTCWCLAWLPASAKAARPWP